MAKTLREWIEMAGVASASAPVDVLSVQLVQSGGSLLPETDFCTGFVRYVCRLIPALTFSELLLSKLQIVFTGVLRDDDCV